MSTLQLSLAIIGGIVLAVIVAYNAWNTHRNTPRRALPESRDGREGQEPSLPPEPALRQEPSFDGAVAPAPMPLNEPSLAPADPDVLAQQHVPTVDAHDALHIPTPAPAHERRLQLDPLIDAMASLLVENLVSGDAALAALPPTRRAGSKPFAIEGFNATTKLWEPPQPGQRYMAFQAGVQLANRTGALSQIEFSEFVGKAQAFCDAVNAAPEFPDMPHEIARARELDQFASEHDAQLSFMLRARQAAWSPGYVQQCAARLGFVPGPIAGRLVLPSSTPGQAPLLHLACDQHAALSEDPDLSAVRDLALSLDVPQVPRGEQPFARLREVATALCQAMDGVLCDQDGNPLPAMAMDAIAADLEQLYDVLDQRELSAGSALARRLFS